MKEMCRASRLVLLSVITVCMSFLCAQPVPKLKERAAQGDAEAQFNLGKMYEAGRGGLKKDPAEAERWYRRAAVQGDPFAQASLGILFRFGKGVTQDYVQAYKWFWLAASRTSGGEQESIAEMRDATAARMTPQQMEAARAQAREWKPVAAQ